MTARRSWARPLTPIYRGVLRYKDWLRSVGWPRTRRLEWPVISVGSLSAGGAGKTPVVMALARMLREAGWTVDVLSRGYGRSGDGVERVWTGARDAARRFGDEPVLIATQTGVPVWVGADRYAAGRRAEAEAGEVRRGVHLLDDGFQHRRLARDVDVVLLTREDLEDALLPAGNLREDLAILTGSNALTVSDAPDFLDRGGMIQFVLMSDRVRFDVNLDAVNRSHLVLSSELLRVAAAVKGKPGGAR